MALEAPPLFLGEFHPLPVLVATRVLDAEAYAPRLTGGALGRRDVSLEFHGVGASRRDGIDEGVREPEASIVRLSNLADNQAGISLSNRAGSDLEAGAAALESHTWPAAMRWKSSWLRWSVA